LQRTRCPYFYDRATTLVTETHVLGAPANRVDGPAKTIGEARCAAEFDYSDLVHAAPVSRRCRAPA